jgi:DNA-binding transcriptional MerR regulator
MDDVRAGGLSVAELAARVGVRPDTIRYYERVALLPAPPRTSGEHRRYGDDAVDRLLFIQGAQRLGLRLREIRDLLQVRDTGQCACEPAAVLLARRLHEIDTEIRRMTVLRADLAAMLTKIPGPDCPEPEPGKWVRAAEGR